LQLLVAFTVIIGFTAITAETTAAVGTTDY